MRSMTYTVSGGDAAKEPFVGSRPAYHPTHSVLRTVDCPALHPVRSN